MTTSEKKKRESKMTDHITEARLKQLATDASPETAELQHLVKCSECFALMTDYIRESITLEDPSASSGSAA